METVIKTWNMKKCTKKLRTKKEIKTEERKKKKKVRNGKSGIETKSQATKFVMKLDVILT